MGTWKAGKSCAGITSIEGPHRPKAIRRRRSAISWSPACGQRCSRRNLSCAAGSPGPGTGPTRCSISSSGPDGWARPATGCSLRSLRADRPALARDSVPGMPGDRQRWNARYGGGFIASFLAHPIAELALSLPLPDGPVLDLASGPSGAALLAAATGRRSVAVDVSDVALGLLAREAARRRVAAPVAAVQADLTSWRPRRESCALVLCTGYWDLDLFPDAAEAVLAGGLLGWEGLTTDALLLRPGMPVQWCLETGEPASLLPAGYDVLSYEDVPDSGSGARRRRLARPGRNGSAAPGAASRRR